MINSDNSVRRMDLDLRLRYLGLDTTIYKLSSWQYCIYCKSCDSAFTEMQRVFDDEIRVIGTAVSLVNSAPEGFISVLDSISLDNPVYGFKRSAVTGDEVKELIQSMFPTVNILEIIFKPGKDYCVTIKVDQDTPESTCVEMRNTLLTRDIGTDDITVLPAEEKEHINQETKTGKEKLDEFIASQRVFSLHLNKKALWTPSEAAYWFEQAESIYNGDLTRRGIPFYRSEQKNCFMSCAVFDCGVDLRNAILLYDTVYLEMPIEQHWDTFLDRQKISKSDLSALIEMGKVVLVLTNDENRYDMTFLNGVYQAMPLGIIGRRGLNTLVAAYLSELNARFQNHYPGLYEEATKMLRFGLEHNDLRCSWFGSICTWPLKAKATSFGYLNTKGPLTLSNYGINQVIQQQLSQIEEKGTRGKVEFEFMINAPAIHIALALNATYIPFRQAGPGNKIYSDYLVSNQMEKFLTMYWYAPNQIEAIYSCRGQTAQEQLNLFHSNPEISIVRIAENADRYNTPTTFGKIIEQLASVPLLKRNHMIREYNDLLLQVSETPFKKSLIEWFLTGTNFIPLNDDLSRLSGVAQFLQTIAGQSTCVMDAKERSDFQRKVAQVSDKFYSPDQLDDIYLLDRIHRVAQLRTVDE